MSTLRIFKNSLNTLVYLPEKLHSMSWFGCSWEFSKVRLLARNKTIHSIILQHLLLSNEIPQKTTAKLIHRFYYPADFVLAPSSIFQSKAFKNTPVFVDVHRANFDAFYNDELQEKLSKIKPNETIIFTFNFINHTFFNG